MDYKKITIGIYPFQEWLRDILASKLAEIGFDSFVDTDSGFDAYIPAADCNKGELNAVLDEFSEDFSFDVKSELIEDRNWNEEWEKNYFKPLVIKDECVVRAPFHTDYPNAKYEIIIEPNMAFGTGNHETTSMMLEYILENDFENTSVLDMGCGTGILGILASMRGAEKITAIDMDEWSFNGTKENSTLNHIQNIEVKLGDVSLLGDEKYGFIFANIQRNVLLADMAAYNKVLNKDGKLFMSGFYSEDIPTIKAKAESLGLKDAGYKVRNNWVAYSFIK
jgi:ribosomal protein L11 methyltransferase